MKYVLIVFLIFCVWQIIVDAEYNKDNKNDKENEKEDE